MSRLDQRYVLAALDSRLGGARDERVVTARAALELFCAETGEPPSKRRYERWRAAREDSAGLPSATFIANTWPSASWSRAMSELGFEPSPDHAARRMAVAGPRRNDEELLAHLRECATELGHTPRRSEYIAWQRAKVRAGNVRYLGEQTYRNRFGDWPRALQAAGLPNVVTRARRVRLTDWASGQPLEQLREAAAGYGGGHLRKEQYEDWRRRRLDEHRARGEHVTIAAGETLCSRYGSWPRALVAAGLLTNEARVNLRRGAGQRFTAAELEAAIARFAKESAGGVRGRDYAAWRAEVMRREDATHLPAHSVLGRRLGGWARVAQSASAHREVARSAG